MQRGADSYQSALMKALRANSLGQTPLAGRCPAACLLVAVEVHHGVNDLLLIICRKPRPDGQCVLMLRAVLGGCEEDAPLSRIREASGSCPLVISMSEAPVFHAWTNNRHAWDLVATSSPYTCCLSRRCLRVMLKGRVRQDDYFRGRRRTGEPQQQ